MSSSRLYTALLYDCALVCSFFSQLKNPPLSLPQYNFYIVFRLRRYISLGWGQCSMSFQPTSQEIIQSVKMFSMFNLPLWVTSTTNVRPTPPKKKRGWLLLFCLFQDAAFIQPIIVSMYSISGTCSNIDQHRSYIRFSSNYPDQTRKSSSFR